MTLDGTDGPRAGSDHAARLRASFTAQSHTFEEPGLNAAFTSALDWMVEAAEPRTTDRCLDLAAGTGLVGRALAPYVAHVTCIDATPAMVDRGRAAAAAEGLTNVTYRLGDATTAAVPDASVDVVVTRFSLHHVPDPVALLRAASTACRPGGRVVVHDLASSYEPEVAERQDLIEAWRDPSHLRAPVLGEVAEWCRSVGLTVDRTEQRRYTRPLEPWLEQALTPPERATLVRAALAEELDGGPATGFAPQRRDDGLWFTQTWELTVAQQPRTDRPK